MRKIFVVICLEIKQLIQYAFQVALVSFLGLYLWEIFSAGAVSRFININIFIGVVIITGVITTIWKNEAHQKTERTSKWFRWAMVIVVSAIGGVFIWLKTGSLGRARDLLTPLSMLIVGFMCWYLMDTDVNEDDNAPARHG